MTLDPTQEKQHLHELVERLSASQISAVRGLLEVMLDPASGAIANAPVAGEPLAEGPQPLDETREFPQTNQGISHEEVLAELGITLAEIGIALEEIGNYREPDRPAVPDIGIS